jgi:hypothetical protein
MHVVPNRIKIIIKTSSGTMILSRKFFNFLINRKEAEQQPEPKLEPEPQFVISALAPLQEPI